MLSEKYENPKCIALVDCNNFYASCERVFRPDWENRPIGVLSNNDGCIVARSNELKEAGIPMGAPYFKYRDELKAMKAIVVSSNYALYGDLSSRVMNVLGRHTPDLEIYSVDEAWLDMTGISKDKLDSIGRDIVRETHLCTGIPVSMGVAPTKVLAKIANRLCKRHKIPGQVFNIGSASNIDDILKSFPVGDVWGIGRQWSKKLNDQGINTALGLRDADPNEMGKIYSVVMQRLILELRGVSCLESLPVEPKKGIVVSKSFGERVTEKEDLIEAVTLYATRAAEKLRNQNSVCGVMQVSIQSGQHNPRDIFYAKAATVRFSVQTSDTRRLISAARKAVEQIFRPGIRYAKAGISLMDLCPSDQVQGDLYESPDSPKSIALMGTIDELNSRYGKRTMRFAGEGIEQGWSMKQNNKTPAYTSSWDEIPSAK